MTSARALSRMMATPSLAFRIVLSLQGPLGWMEIDVRLSPCLGDPLGPEVNLTVEGLDRINFQ